MTPSLKRTLGYFGATAIGQIFSFLLLPIMTYALVPEQFGEYVLGLSISSLVGMLGSAWIRNISMRLYFDHQKDGTSRSFFWSLALLQGMIFSGLYLLMIAAFQLLSVALVSLPVLVAAGTAVLIGDFYGFAVNLLRAENRTVAFAVAEVGNNLLRFILTAGGLWLGLRSPAFLFIASAIAYLVSGMQAGFSLQSSLQGSARIDGQLMLQVTKLAPATLPLSASRWVEQLSDRLVLDRYTTTAIVGVYSAGYSLAERVLGSLTGAVFMMAWPDILHAWNEDGMRGARKAMRQAHLLFAWLSIGPAVFMIAFAPQIVLVLGADYRGTAVIIPVVIAAAWLKGFTQYTNRHFELLKNFWGLSAVAMVGAALNLALNILLIPRAGIIGAAWASLLAYAVMTIVFLYLRDRNVLIPWREYALAALVSTVCWLPSLMLPTSPFVCMTIFVVMYVMAVTYRLLILRSNSSS